MPPQLCSRTRQSQPVSVQSIFTLPSHAQPPLYRINLSLPPRERYKEICKDYKTELLQISPLYDEILGLTPFPRLFKGAARLLLRRVHSEEENEEISGISQATGISKHLVIAFNTFLDLLSGCISGGVKVVDGGSDGRSSGIVHFRGLDWEMDVLRDLTICVEYVREGQVIARGVTYAGYIGVLTGVREGLSISLNYRPTPTRSKLARYLHYISIILGRRPSNTSILRRILLTSQPPPSSRKALEAEIFKYPGSPCYLTFCTPNDIFVFEHGLDGSTTHSSDSFLAVTNHDKSMEDWTEDQWNNFLKSQLGLESGAGHTVRDLVADSVERKNCVCGLWESVRVPASGKPLKIVDVVDWLQTKPLLNEDTHYSCVMNPAVCGGGLHWVVSYDEPVKMDQPSSSEDSDE
ncbi:hypothetical protein E1B28_007112 [Marasmius oreades]|uniref:ceramidase n=1 Tax=Marasmius oreades TaxID=181124 RepID=A0A9P7S2N7_9AGAR|nr:uncharacterized protein E1B28_007112 [Marasmius oreades]KAG7093433.1 hypothetical protein E1B28_007112 [Marasmius oreades]